MTLDPIADFRRSQSDTSALSTALHQGWLRRACEAILQDLALHLPPTANPEASAAVFQQMFGAKSAIATLLNMDQPWKEEQPRQRTDNVIQWPQ